MVGGFEIVDEARARAVRTVPEAASVVRVASGEVVGGGRGEGFAAPHRFPMGASFTVRREDLMREVVRSARDAGIVLVVAPAGFGKTALLIQYVEEVRSDPGRGVAVLLDVEGCSASEVRKRMGGIVETLDAAAHPLIALDNLSPWSSGKVEEFASDLRTLRDKGFEVVASCEPTCRSLMKRLGDAAKLNAQALKVRPREYAAWMKTFSIDRTLDVYRLTQGIPVLIAALGAWGPQGAGGMEALDGCVDELYRGVFQAVLREGERLARAASLMLLMGEGSIDDIGRCGPPVAPEVLVRLTHDYPVFGYDAAAQAFACLGTAPGALASVREQIAASYPALVKRAARILLRARRTDEAVALARDHLAPGAQLELIEEFPVRFSFAGHARYVADAIDAGERAGRLPEPGVAVTLARYTALILLGDFKLAGACAARLRARAHQVVEEVDAGDWACARALAGLLGGYEGIVLPQVSFPQAAGASGDDAKAVEDLARALGRFFATDTPRGLRHRRPAPQGRLEVDVPYVLGRCAELVDEAARGEMDAPGERDGELEEAARRMRDRQLAPLCLLIRLVLSMRRLFAGAPVTDERAFSDAGTMAIRLSDQPLQLLCMMLEGWQNLAVNQMVNAQFRGQQVLRLAGPEPTLLRAWSRVLERSAHLMSASRVAVGEEAELVDLARRDVEPAEAWSTALTLSAAHLDGELAAWCSLHKQELAAPELRLPARLAMTSMGTAADALRRLVPASLAGDPRAVGEVEPDPVFQVIEGRVQLETGQFGFKLLGGFSIERNGHIITDAIWRRRKVSILAARLVLAMGSFVSRQILMDELWPGCDYKHARDSLYSALSVLRKAMGQVRGGPQFVISQGEGVAVNNEFVVSDIYQFEMLARTVLLKRAGVTAPQLIEACLKIEQVYQGPLYVPDRGNPAFFLRMRSVLQTKFVDCMLRGVETALDEEDLASASWMTEAALGQAPVREDVVRAAMRVYDLGGRRTDVVELYRKHARYLEQQAKGVPEPETRELYERIINQPRGYGAVRA